jgi:hypothetical protein
MTQLVMIFDSYGILIGLIPFLVWIPRTELGTDRAGRLGFYRILAPFDQINPIQFCEPGLDPRC